MKLSALRSGPAWAGRWASTGRFLAAHRRLTPVIAPVLALTPVAGVAAASTWPAHPRSLGPRPTAAVFAGQAAQAAQVAGSAAGLGSWVSRLSAGAPAGAVTLTATPALFARPAPATSAVIAGLAADGIPKVALNAYRVAAARINASLPACGIDWSLVAAIGRVESDHGQFGGATLGPDGTSAPKIIGPALNGQGFAFIHDTDHGGYDGDPVYDRAVGPMQFIPSTWVSYAVDGNGDGTASPFDINDAALAAAHYLCVAGGDLHSAAGQQRAVLAYNDSSAYLAEVLALARGYATGTQVDAPLVGSTSAAVPAPTGDYLAPAAPGPAPAAAPSSGHQPAPAPAQQQRATQAAAAGAAGPAPRPATASRPRPPRDQRPPRDPQPHQRRVLGQLPLPVRPQLPRRRQHRCLLPEPQPRSCRYRQRSAGCRSLCAHQRSRSRTSTTPGTWQHRRPRSAWQHGTPGQNRDYVLTGTFTRTRRCGSYV